MSEVTELWELDSRLLTTKGAVEVALSILEDSSEDRHEEALSILRLANAELGRLSEAANAMAAVEK